MKNNHSDPGVDVKNSRRTFLRQSVAAGAGAVLLAGQAAEAGPAAPPLDEAASSREQGYRVTPHIAAYYQSAS
ncbi:MAG TPA: twin-arginine translocation signal domain-containing protein [Thiolinea sp.]|nr:twin-arginine translocation signal domain-containing protein [Thiolinea sp.]